MKTSISVLVLSSLSLLGLAGCDQKIDKTKLEASINDGTKAKGINFKSVDCPPEQLMKKGADFDCKATTTEGDSIVVHITQKDDSGDIGWNLVGTILDTAKLGDSIESKVGAGADVKCPSTTIILTKGKVVKCKVSQDGATKDVMITATDDDGNVNWKIGG